MTWCKGCVAYQQVRKVDMRCANCPSVRKRKPKAWRKAARVQDRRR